MAEAYLAIQYIGGWPVKTDNIIHGSGRVWKGYGSSQRVPERDAAKYLVHDDEFRLLHPLFLESPAAESLSKDDQIDAMLTIASNLELHAAEELLIACQYRIEELKSSRGNTSIASKDRARFNERQATIAAAIAEMDVDNRDHYTDMKRPRVSKVNEIAGLTDISSAEIVEVVRRMKITQEAAA